MRMQNGAGLSCQLEVVASTIALVGVNTTGMDVQPSMSFETRNIVQSGLFYPLYSYKANIPFLGHLVQRGHTFRRPTKHLENFNAL